MRLFLNFPPVGPTRILAALCVCLGLACTKTPQFTGTPFDPPEPVPALVLARADGAPFDIRAQEGKVVLLFFGYTNCPDVCPTTLADWIKVSRALGKDTARVRFVFISLDPDRDSPVVATNYARTFHPSFIGLSADSAHVAQIAQSFHVSSTRDLSPEFLNDTSGTLTDSASTSYTISHSPQTFVVDPQGNLRLIFNYNTPVDAVTRDIQTLLK